MKHNCETGETIEYEIQNSNFLKESRAMPAAKSIIGQNSWFRIERPSEEIIPYRCIGQVVSKWTDKKTKKGTATMVSKSTALTSGNIIYDKKLGGYADSVTVTIARDNEFIPHGIIKSYELDIPTRYYNYEDDAYDLGLITLSSPVGADSDFVKCENINSDSLQEPNVWIHVYGYPREGVSTPDLEYPITSGKEMWGGAGKVSNISSGVITHDAATVTGMSGAPILAFNDNLELVIAGVHTVGKTTYNMGIKLKPTFLDWVNENR